MSRYTIISLLRDLNRISRSAAYRSRVEENRKRRAYEKMCALQAREEKAASREEKARYIARRTKCVEEMNQEVCEDIEALESLLKHTLTIDDTVQFYSLLTKDDFPALTIPKEIAKPALEPERRIADLKIRSLNFIERLFRSKRVERQHKAQADLQVQYDEAYNKDKVAYNQNEQARVAKLLQIQKEYDSKKAAFEKELAARNSEIASFKQLYMQGDVQAVEAYNTLVLNRSEYVDDFPDQQEVKYFPETKTLTVKKQLPLISVVPSVAEYKYVKSSDAITEKARSKADTKRIYVAIVSQIVLRTLHEVLEADQGGWINSVNFIGYVETTNPANGDRWTPTIACLIVDAAKFKCIRLDQVDPVRCFASLDGRLVKQMDGSMSLNIG